MIALASLLKRFRSDQSGAFAVIFAILSVVLIAFSGAVVDFVSLEQTRTRAQVALDAATLALQNNIFLTPLNTADIRTKALALVNERISDNRVVVTMDTPAVNVTDGSLLLTAHFEMPTIFVSMVGVPKMRASIYSEATRKKLALEVVMVLDNSGSMANSSRMTNLKAAAACATNILFYSAVDAVTCAPTSAATLVANVKVGIVPFTMFVNVDPTNSNQAWIDKLGASSIANDNFDNDDNDGNTYSGAVNRLGLFTAVNEGWRGCVESRPHTSTAGGGNHYLDTDDTPATSGDTLFVPQFSTDEADTISGLTLGNNYQSYLPDAPAACDRPSSGGASCTVTETKTGCNSTMSNGTCASAADGYSFTGPVNTTISGKYYGAYPASCSCRSWGGYSSWNQTSGSGSNRTFARTRTCSSGYVPTGLSDRENQERLCKYTGAVTGSDFTTGPNADCTNEPILPLTTSVAAVQQTITDMAAAGGTNIHEGAAWGFRALSPGAPFTQGATYSTATKKVMIIMTDGENTSYNINSADSIQNAIRGMNGSIWYSAYGWPYNGRLGGVNPANATMVTEMNNRTLQTCMNAKESGVGIDIYTIGLATSTVTQSTQAVVEQMLKDCATTQDKAYFPATSSALIPVFKTIAAQLAQLRLAQ